MFLPQFINNVSKWELDDRDNYGGPEGGPRVVGPSSAIQRLACRAKDLSCVFLALIPLSFFEEVAKLTNKYAYKDFVIKTPAPDRDGHLKSRRVLTECNEYTGSEKTRGARHRADNEKYKFKATAGYVICWIAILILQGALFGTHKPPSRTMWESFPYGLPIPYVKNAISGGAYEFMRRFIHFSDNR